MQDCAGVYLGSAVLDSCGQCLLDKDFAVASATSTLDSNTKEDSNAKDCAGICLGPFLYKSFE